MMLLQLIACVGLFFGLTFGVAWPVAARLKLEAAEKLVAAAMLSLLGTYFIAFAIYLLNLPLASFWVLSALALAGLYAGRSTLVVTVRDADARAMLAGQLLVTGWCVGWLFFIANYTGGGWAGDWYEHWERTRFFLGHWAHDAKFLGVYTLPARPPLANLLTGALLALTSPTYASYQLFTALLSSLAFLPAALLVRRFAPTAARVTAVAVLAVLLMLNPSFVENATFAWTKLTAVFFILSGLYFFLRTLDAASPPFAGPLCAAALAAGLLSHYSAGPYVLLLAGAWLLLQRARWMQAAFWRQTATLALIGGLVLATWFGWSFAIYGAHTTLLSNSSIEVKDVHTGNQFLKIALNLRDTLVPHFLRPLDGSLITQSSRWGYWHDWLFQLYQLNLFFVFGSVAWLVLIRELVRAWPVTPGPSRWFWTLFCGGVVVLGVAVHGARDTWGLAHICLQALTLVGLAYLAARWPALGRGWRRALVAGATIDFILGIALHFAVESYIFDRWLTPNRPPEAVLKSYSSSSLMNMMGKIRHQLGFVRDDFTLPGAVVLILLAGILVLAVFRAARRPR